MPAEIRGVWWSLQLSPEKLPAQPPPCWTPFWGQHFPEGLGYQGHSELYFLLPLELFCLQALLLVMPQRGRGEISPFTL